MSNVAPPAEIAWLADRIGAEATLLLIERMGGTRVYVPKHAAPDCVLAGAIGVAATAALAAEFGGSYIKVPLARAWRARLYRARGDTYREIARRLCVVENSVWRLLSDAGMTSPQLQLPL